MSGSAIKYWLTLMVLLGTFYGSFVWWRNNHSEARMVDASRAVSRLPKGPPLTDFVLTGQDGEKFDSASLRGKVWVGSFFFTNCPGACWRLNQALSDLQKATPTSEVLYISITCDPDNDTPEALTQYAHRFEADPARWKFLTGDFSLIRRIGNDFFKVSVDKGTHSDRAFVVDRLGQVRGRFRLTEPNQLEMLKSLISVVEAEPATASQPVEHDAASAVPPGET